MRLPLSTDSLTTPPLPIATSLSGTTSVTFQLGFQRGSSKLGVILRANSDSDCAYTYHLPPTCWRNSPSGSSWMILPVYSNEIVTMPSVGLPNENARMSSSFAIARSFNAPPAKLAFSITSLSACSHT